MQEHPRDCSDYYGAKFRPKLTGSKGAQAKSKEKIKSNKGAVLKGLSVTQWILSARKKDKKEGHETFEESKGHTFGGQPKRSTVLV